MKRQLSEILKDFNEPINPQYLSKKPVYSKGKKIGDVEFIAWPNLCKILNQYTDGNWEWKIRTQFMGDRTLVEGSLTIHGNDGSLTREATGNEMSDVDGYGDPSSNAEAMALRRAAAKFGIGLYLWDKKSQSQSSQSQSTPQTRPQTIKPQVQPQTTGKKEITREEWLARKNQNQNYDSSGALVNHPQNFEGA